MADVLDTSTDALRRWMSRVSTLPGTTKKLGRPEVIPTDARWKLRRCHEEHYGQWGPSVLSAWARRQRLGTWSPTTVAKVVADLRPSPPERPKPSRVEITASGVMWSEDGAAFRDRGRKRELLVVQDEHARFKTAHCLAEGPATGDDVLELLKTAFSEHGPPLILKRDGGSIFDDQRVMAFLDEQDVVVVTSPPGC